MGDLQNAKYSEDEERARAFSMKLFLIVTVAASLFTGAVIIFVL